MPVFTGTKAMMNPTANTAADASNMSGQCKITGYAVAMKPPGIFMNPK